MCAGPDPSRPSAELRKFVQVCLGSKMIAASRQNAASAPPIIPKSGYAVDDSTHCRLWCEATDPASSAASAASTIVNSIARHINMSLTAWNRVCHNIGYRLSQLGCRLAAVRGDYPITKPIDPANVEVLGDRLFQAS